MSFLHRTIVCSLLASIGLLSSTTQAEQLEPALKAHDVIGTVQVQRPDAKALEPVEQGVAYPYGSHFRTDADSSVKLAMSPSSSIRVLAVSDVVILDSRLNRDTKVVRVLEGEVEAELSKTFHEDGNLLNIEAGLAIVQAKGTKYRVASRMEEDLRIVVVRVLEGLVRIMGEHFAVPELEESEWVSLLGPNDESFLRIKNMEGTFEVSMKDEDHSDRQIETQKGTVLKIWKRTEPESGDRIITSVLTDPAGEMVDTTTVVYSAGEFGEFDAEVREQERERQPDPERNPPVMPPDDVMEDMVDRLIQDENPQAGRRPAPPRPPVQPTPTPVGNL